MLFVLSARSEYTAPGTNQLKKMINTVSSYFRTDVDTFNHLPTAVRLGITSSTVKRNVPLLHIPIVQTGSVIQ